MLDGRAGVRHKSQRLTELVGGIVLRSYVPHGTKRIGEGEGHFERGESPGDDVG